MHASSDTAHPRLGQEEGQFHGRAGQADVARGTRGLKERANLATSPARRADDVPRRCLAHISSMFWRAVDPNFGFGVRGEHLLWWPDPKHDGTTTHVP
eukprot:CAMPEP_0118963206 /NCGR_PEP_ID=MMETSP1173-20130426/1216_1 /TAXON_ID=1034831 /ORGANISM="Rhizochromulina marina cf, Strain CCMP1243" /LENGTH=97 /DNA_ID=CAMNT_0006911525 /DNA_START=99 /DNA_END=389 /DNA_ORIENTATION=+